MRTLNKSKTFTLPVQQKPFIHLSQELVRWTIYQTWHEDSRCYHNANRPIDRRMPVHNDKDRTVTGGGVLGLAHLDPLPSLQTVFTV